MGGSPTLLNSYCQLTTYHFGPHVTVKYQLTKWGTPDSMKQPASLGMYHLKRLPEPQTQTWRLIWIAWKKRRPMLCLIVLLSRKTEEGWAKDIRSDLIPPSCPACP